MLASMKRQARRHSNPVSLAVLSLATAASTVAVVLLSGALTSEAVQDPTLSLDMDPGGNSYNDTTNTMTVGTIDNCLTEPGNDAQHNLQAHLIIQNVEDVAGIQARFNFDSTKAKVTNFINAPFQDTSRIQNVGFLNLPLDPAIGNNHRDLTGASDFSAPNTALVAASYLGDQTFPISPDTPAKSPTPDDTSYSAPTGGIFGTVVIQVQDGQAGQSSLAIDLDDGDPILPGSSVDIFTGGGIQNQDIEKVNLEGFRLGDGFIGNGVTCVPLPQETPPAATPTATPTPTVTPTPCPGCTPTPTVTPPPRTPGGSFDPQISQTYSTTEPGSHPDIASTLSIGLGPDGVILTADDTGGYNFGGIVNFSPSSPQDADVPDGAILGELKSVEGLGVLNNPCNRRIDIDSLPPKFTFMEATTDNTNTVEALPFGFGNELAIIAGDTPPFDGIQDVKPPPAVTKYPAFLNAIFDPDWVDFGPDKIAGNADDNNGPAPPIKPRFRFVGVTSIGFAGGLWTVRQEVVFEPGTKLPRLPAFDPSLGFPSVTVLQQSSAAGSATPPAPSAITDSCTPLKQDSLSLGVTHDNPDTPANEGGIPVRTLPGAGTPITSTFYSFSQRDADGDGFENTLDTCPFNFDALWNPHSLTSPAPDDDDVVAGLHTGDGIPNTCDPTPTEASGNQPTDHDNDGFANSGDNCPLHYNPDQADSDVNADGEIVGDGIGDACDTPGTDAGFDCVGAGCSGATPRPIPPRTVSGKGPNVPDGEPLLCVRLITVTVGGPNQAAVSECLEQAPPLVPVDAGAPVDGDGDQVSDAGDNCPATPNADQLDSDQDGIGDVCDPTPVHDLTVVGVKANNATLRLQPVGTAIMHVRATVQNVVNYPETLSLGVDVAGLPAGCEVAGVSRDTTGSIRRLGKSTYQLDVSITCAASLAVPGTYPLTLTATVTHTGSGIENNTLNNSGGATARLRIR